MNQRSDLIDLTLNIHAETEKAIAVSDDGSTYIWLPKSQIEYAERGDSIVEVSMPNWLAVEKGLV